MQFPGMSTNGPGLCNATYLTLGIPFLTTLGIPFLTTATACSLLMSAQPWSAMMPASGSAGLIVMCVHIPVQVKGLICASTSVGLLCLKMPHSIPFSVCRLGLRKVVRFWLGCHKLPVTAQRNEGVARANRLCLHCDLMGGHAQILNKAARPFFALHFLQPRAS